ncbi:hypothetical protein I3842_07G089500 [Carya illinoinensis]|uniref:Uncharacterized protein n=1 Tax=Carya illinoinensis TaxID=32201 RepID=A0A922EH17_CARIL|nr:hypothetical protein I3842_07G089500 [Carya illinoinensis]
MNGPDRLKTPSRKPPLKPSLPCSLLTSSSTTPSRNASVKHLLHVAAHPHCPVLHVKSDNHLPLSSTAITHMHGNTTTSHCRGSPYFRLLKQSNNSLVLNPFWCHQSRQEDNVASINGAPENAGCATPGPP